MRLVNITNGATLADDIEEALSHSQRRKGLLGRDSLEPGAGLCFPRCRQVHTFGMRFPIDVLFIDRDGKLIRSCSGLEPGRLSPLVPRSRNVVELPSGTCETTGTHPGHTLELLL